MRKHHTEHYHREGGSFLITVDMDSNYFSADASTNLLITVANYSQKTLLASKVAKCRQVIVYKPIKHHIYDQCIYMQGRKLILITCML